MLCNSLDYVSRVLGHCIKAVAAPPEGLGCLHTPPPHFSSRSGSNSFKFDEKMLGRARDL